MQIPFHPCFLQAPGPWKSPLPHLFSMTGRQSDQQFLCLFNILQAHPTSHLPTHPPTSTSTRTAFKRGGPGASAPSPRTKAPGGCSRRAQTRRRTDGGHTIADADKQGGHRGQGQGSGRRGAPTGSGPVLEAVGGPDGPPQETSREEEGRDPHLPPLRDRHRGRQEKVCLTRASSGSGPWASRGVRGTRPCRVPSEAEGCGAGEAAEVAEPCRQRLHSGSSARISSSSRNGLSPKRSSSCRRSWGRDVGVPGWVPGLQPGPLPNPHSFHPPSSFPQLVKPLAFLSILLTSLLSFHRPQ